MYAMCTGRSPFRATTVTGAIHRVCEDTPRPIQEMNPEIPDWLTEIIDRLLTKKPEERFQTAGEVAEELGEYLALVQQPSRVRLPSSSVAPKRTRSEKLGSRGQRILAVAGMVCVGLALLAVFGWAKIMGRSPYFTMPPAPEGYSFVCLGDGANMPLSDGTDTPLNNLSELSTGVQTFANVPFFISDEYIRLNGYKAGVFDAFPPEVKALPVDRRAKRVHFFHGLQGGGDKGLTVAQYTVHYNDGTDQTIPIVTGEDIWDWWEATMRWPVTKAYSAWTGNNPAQRLAQKRSKEPLRLTLYRTEWKNPYPEKTIRSIDFIRTGDASPFCVAITCQDSDDDPIPPVAPAPEPAKITRVVAVENVWAAPNLTVLPDGTITMVIFNQSWFEDTEGDVECWASTDGLQWEKRGQVTQHDTETTRFNVAAGLANNGDLLVACSGRAKEQQPRQPNRAAFCGKVLRLWICRSADGGRTWESTKEFPAPEAGCMEYCPFGDIVRASDGSLRMSCYHVRWGRAGTDAATSGPRSWMFRSDDDGSSWQRVSMIGPQHYETFVFHLDETKWLAVARCDATDLFHSDDDGQTWHRPQRVTGPGEYHAHLLKLRDGRLLLTYNNRIPKQTGALARLSADEGKTWTSPIRLATSETWDCGYPSSIQRPDGKIVTAYYSGAAPECGHRHVGVALWDAPKLVSDDRR